MRLVIFGGLVYSNCVMSEKEKGKIVKSRLDGEDFWYVVFPGERTEEFDTENEALLYLADLRKMGVKNP